MRKLAEAIEYSPAAIYLHFKSRDGIARALCLQGFEELLSWLEPAAREPIAVRRLRALAEAYVGFGLKHPETYRLLFMTDPEYTTDIFRSPEDSGGRAFRVMAELVEDLKRQGEMSDTVSVIPWAEVLWRALQEALTGLCSQGRAKRTS
jgi:AcrR family transcriptional regulator